MFECLRDVTDPRRRGERHLGDIVVRKPLAEVLLDPRDRVRENRGCRLVEQEPVFQEPGR